MARELKDIKKEIAQKYIENEIIKSAYNLPDGALFNDYFSIVSLESLLFDALAFSIWMLEKLFDNHTKEIDQALYDQKSGTIRWYQLKSLAFQFGFDLIEDSDKFDNTGATTEQIEQSKIVKYCSVKETQQSNKLFIKIASEDNGVLSPIEPEELDSFLAYMQEIKYAGVRIQVVNNPADILGLTMAIYRDPLVIDENGNSILNGGKPVEEAIMSYLQNLPFNGEFLINDFIAHLRAVPGVKNVNIMSITSSYYDVVPDDYTNPVQINVSVIPSAGYFTITNFANLSYVV